MTTETLIDVWSWIYAVGLGSFFLLALFVIPLGARDVLRLFGPAKRKRE